MMAIHYVASIYSVRKYSNIEFTFSLVFTTVLLFWYEPLYGLLTFADTLRHFECLFPWFPYRRFTEEELHTLKKLQTLHGNKWAKISALTGRSESALEKRFAQMCKSLGTGIRIRWLIATVRPQRLSYCFCLVDERNVQHHGKKI